MAITTWTELKTAVGDWLDRSDLSSYLADFITLAEGHFNRGLRHRKMVTRVDLTPTDNVCTLPDDYLAYLRVVELASIRRELEFISPNVADQMYPAQVGGLASHFTIIGDDLTAYPLSSNDIELTYYAKLEPLSGSVASNWLLVASPELYLRGAQLMAMEFTGETDTPRYQGVALLVQKLIDDLNSENDRALYSKAAMHVRAVLP